MIRQSRRAVSFEQVFFSSSLEGCSSGDADGLVTGFPVFDLPTGGEFLPTGTTAMLLLCMTAMALGLGAGR